MLYDEKIEALISAALADGVLTEKEKQVLFKRAQAEGIDLDEFEMVLDARLVELKKAEEAKIKAEKEKADKSAPKSNKYGDVRKCPVCGAMVPALAATCPECGYEFSGVDANLSSQKLADKLITAEKECEIEKQKELEKFKPSAWSSEEKAREVRIEKGRLEDKYKKIAQERKKTIIETFPIPNTKSDLFEFITALLPKIGDRQLGKAYRAKVEECILKANTLFPNDSTFAKITNQAQLDIKKHKQRKLIIILSIICAAILGIGIPALWGITHSKAYNQKKINEYLNQGRPEKAVKFCMRDYKYADYDQLRVCNALAEKGKADEAISLYLVSHSKDTYKSENTAEIRKALIREKRYDEALEYTNYETYGLTVFWILQDYCNDGKKQEAHRFLRLHSLKNIDRYDKLHETYKSNDIDREIRSFIDNY